MNTYEIIKELVKQRFMTVAQLERTLDLSNGSISKWAKSKPNSEPLEKVADYLNVSTDYLLGRTENAAIPGEKVTKTEIDLKKDASESFFYDGHELNDEDLDLISSLLEARMRNRK